jgi:hypothetical protein
MRAPDPCLMPSQLLLDMPICWSSTYVMLDRADKKRQVRAIAYYGIY